MKLAIPYYRVSTKKQERSHLGLDAQQDAVNRFALQNDYFLLPSYTEAESGRKKSRPMLNKALQQCKRLKALLLIAKLDRLARNVHLIASLIDAKIDFLAVDYPTTDKMIIYMQAVFAEYERDQTSKRTKEALKAAKERGVTLGKYGRDVLSLINRNKADDFASKMLPIIEQLRHDGYTSVRALSRQLNRKRIAPFQGRAYKWHKTSVYNLLKRIDKLKPYTT
jgi:DNA invertase Pin-like site-specific DNA recombinase